jgi:hypothetical protein
MRPPFHEVGPAAKNGGRAPDWACVGLQCPEMEIGVRLPFLCLIPCSYPERIEAILLILAWEERG